MMIGFGAGCGVFVPGVGRLGCMGIWEGVGDGDFVRDGISWGNVDGEGCSGRGSGDGDGCNSGGVGVGVGMTEGGGRGGLLCGVGAGGNGDGRDTERGEG